MNPRVMLLIDADNVSLDLIEQAMAQLLAEYGALHVRRAYCTAESALKNQTAFKRLGIRPMVNLAAGKNSTDIALAVDALDLVLAERPDVVVIASSDSDFAPLVSRLREKGCCVRGVGQQGKTGEQTQQIYDDFVVLTHRGEAAEPAAAKPAAKKAPAKKAVTAAKKPAKAAPKAAAKPVAKKSAVKKSAAKKAPAKHAEAPAAPTLATEEWRRIVDAAPMLAGGERIDLGVVAKALRDQGLLGKNASSTRLLQKHPQHFELLPPEQPNRVRWRGGS